MLSFKLFKWIFISVLLHLMVGASYSQTLNQYDNKGLKQGAWSYTRVDTIGAPYGYNISAKRVDHTNTTDSLHKEQVKRIPRYRVISQIMAKGNYLHDVPDGHWTYYSNTRLINRDKTREEKFVYKGDSSDFEYVVCKEISKNEIDYKLGTIHGMFKMYYPNGTIKSELSFVDNKPLGSIKTYFDTGKIMFEGELLPGEKFYHLTEYYYTGSKRGARKLSISYIMDNFTNLDEIKEIHSGL